MRRLRHTDVRVLLIEPDLRLREACAAALRRAGIDVVAVSSGDDALEMLELTAVDVVVSETDGPEVGGVALLGALRERARDLPIILMTSAPQVETAIVAVNFGVYKYLVKPIDPSELVGFVRRAAKLRGLARLTHEATAAVDTEDPARQELSQRFSRALAAMWMAYQPIVDAEHRDLLGFEALMRVPASDFGGPDQLIAAAHQLDRTLDLGRRTRSLVARDLRRIPDGAQIFVNLLPGDLLDLDLFDAAKALGPFAPRVVFELTERSSLDAIPELQRRVGHLREIGYRIALDDLGAGYSGLSSLTQLEPDIVKLDRSLIHGVHHSARRRAVVGSVVSLCRSLDVSVIGEGVEWEAEAETLRSLHVSHLQGFLIAPPGRAINWPRAPVH